MSQQKDDMNNDNPSLDDIVRKNLETKNQPLGASLTADASLLGGAPRGKPMKVPNVVEATPPDPSNKEAYDAYIASIAAKRARTPYGSRAQKLAYPERSGYKRHWFNDIAGRVQEHLDTGWAHVLDQKGSPVNRNVGSGRDNRALMAFLLEIPSVFWEESQAIIHAEAKARMDDIKKAPIRAPQGSSQASDRDKFYSPREDIVSMKDTLSRS